MITYKATIVYYFIFFIIIISQYDNILVSKYTNSQLLEAISIDQVHCAIQI